MNPWWRLFLGRDRQPCFYKSVIYGKTYELLYQWNIQYFYKHVSIEIGPKGLVSRLEDYNNDIDIEHATIS